MNIGKIGIALALIAVGLASNTQAATAPPKAAAVTSATLEACVVRDSAAQSEETVTVVSLAGYVATSSDSSGCFSATVGANAYGFYFDALTSPIPPLHSSSVNVCINLNGAAVAGERVYLVQLSRDGTLQYTEYPTGDDGCVTTAAIVGPYALAAGELMQP